MADDKNIQAKLKLEIVNRYGGDDKLNLNVLIKELLNIQKRRIIKTIKEL